MCFSLLNEDSFLELMYILDRRYVPPDRQTIRERIEVAYQSAFEKIQNILKNVSVNVTCDIWTSVILDPYLGITAHYIDANWIYRSHILDVSLFPHPHDNQSITAALKEVKICSFNLIQLLYLIICIGNEEI